MLTLLIDMDNVVANLMKKWLDSYNSEYDDCLNSEQITRWQIDTHATKCTPKEFYGLIERAEFFSDLEVMPNSIEVTGRLQENGHELYFVTATPYNNPTGGFDKQNWVEKYFPHIGRTKVIQSHHKHMIRGDLLLDDSPTNLRNFPGMKVVMDMAYNRDFIADFRVKNWLEFEKIINELEAAKE